MKKTYTAPEMEVELFECADVITTSNEPESVDNFIDFGDFTV